MIVKKTTNKKHLTQVKNTCYNIYFFWQAELYMV